MNAKIQCVLCSKKINPDQYRDNGNFCPKCISATTYLSYLNPGEEVILQNIEDMTDAARYRYEQKLDTYEIKKELYDRQSLMFKNSLI